MWKFVNVPGNLSPNEHDFFEYNPELQYFSLIQALIKDEGKDRASLIMWAIYLTEDTDSKFFNLTEKRSEIEKNFLDEELDWDKYKILIDAYPKMAMSPAKRNYQRGLKLYERELADAEKEGGKKAENFLLKGYQMQKTLDSLEAKAEEEKVKGVELKGDRQAGKFA